MNPLLKGHILSRLDKVFDGTINIFSDQFFSTLTLVANALDNVQARRYVTFIYFYPFLIKIIFRLILVVSQTKNLYWKVEPSDQKVMFKLSFHTKLKVMEASKILKKKVKFLTAL